MSLQVLSLWSLITILGLLAAISLSVCINLHIPKYRSFFIFSDLCWFMFIPLVRYLDVVVPTYQIIIIIIIITLFRYWSLENSPKKICMLIG